MTLPFESKAFVVSTNPHIVYDDVSFEPVDKDGKMFVMRGTQVKTKVVRANESFERFYQDCSREYQAKIAQTLREKGFEAFSDKLRVSNPSLCYYLLNFACRMYSFGTRGASKNKFTKILMKGGIYDTGFRQRVEMLVSADDIKLLEAIPSVGVAATSFTG